jgi:hypothetical protein
MEVSSKLDPEKELKKCKGNHTEVTWVKPVATMRAFNAEAGWYQSLNEIEVAPDTSSHLISEWDWLPVAQSPSEFPKYKSVFYHYRRRSKMALGKR